MIMKTIITTVGTSIFLNYQKTSNAIDDKIKDLELKSYKEWKTYEMDIQKIKNLLNEWINDNSSAELKSILKLKDLYNEIRVQLITTDTILSPLAAQIIQKYLNAKNIECEFSEENDIIKGLQVSDRKTFEKDGIVNLVERAHKIIKDCYYENVIFNITAGYKAVIPYMTIMAQINNIAIFYIFEDTDDLIKIPQAPLSINWQMFEKYANLLSLLERGIEKNWQQIKREQNIDADFSSCIWEEDDMAELNAIGKIFWQVYKANFMVKIVRNSGYFDDNPGNRKQLIESFRELYQRLSSEIRSNAIHTTDSLVLHIRTLTDQHDLRHGPVIGTNKFIFKSTAKGQIRIVYSPELKNSELSLRIYDYKRGAQINHSRYIKNLKVKIENMKDLEWEFIPIKKH